jgi:hypothetical protein
MPQSWPPPIPRLFGDTEMSAMDRVGGGAEGVGGACAQLRPSCS